MQNPPPARVLKGALSWPHKTPELPASEYSRDVPYITAAKAVQEKMLTQQFHAEFLFQCYATA